MSVTTPLVMCMPGQITPCNTGTLCADGAPPRATCTDSGSFTVCACPGGANANEASGHAGAPSTGGAGATPLTEGRSLGAGSSAAAGSGTHAWTMMGYDASNTYFNPSETKLSIANAALLKELWRFTVSGTPMGGTPLIVAGKVFVMTSGGTYAIDLASGTQVWKRADIAGTAALAYNDGAVYAHGSGTELYRLKATDGSTVWGPVRSNQASGCDGTSSPIVASGKVLVGHSCSSFELAGTSSRGGVEAFDAATGTRAWTYYTVPANGEDGAMVWSSVSVDASTGVVFAGTGNNYTRAGANSDALHAIDLASGMKKWVKQVRAADTWCCTNPGADNDFGANPILGTFGGKRFVAAGDKNAAFWFLDRETGEVVWSRTNLSSARDRQSGGVLMNGAFDGTYFYVVSNQPPDAAVLHALDPSKQGLDAWTPKTFTQLAWGAPSVANGVLVVPIDANLYVLNAHNGDMLTMFKTGGTIAAGAPSIVDGKIVVKSGMQYVGAPKASTNNQIICYGLP